MKEILVVGEDSLCCVLGEKLVATILPGWSLIGPSIDKKGITNLIPAMPRFAKHAEFSRPVLCVADSDGRCAVELIREWRPSNAPESFMLRLAVNEAESWLLADRRAFSEALGVPLTRLPSSTDDLPDPKSVVLRLLAKSKVRLIRDEVVSRTDPNKKGSGYNLHLCNFVRKTWDAERARPASASLGRAISHIRRIGAAA